MKNTIDCIIVTYRPEILLLKKTIESIQKQVRNCYIINNGIDLSLDNKKITIVNLGKNYGIAYALNRGIEIARRNNADFIILSDQDTIYPADYVKKNIIAYDELKYRKVAALTPVVFDKIRNKRIPIMVRKFSRLNSKNNYFKNYIRISHTITSGTFIIVDSLDDVGLMNEKLFIDCVDFEWCWRVNALGYKIFSIPDLVIFHKLGDGVKVVFGKVIEYRSDTRYYYMIRNTCYLARFFQYLKWYERVGCIKKVLITILKYVIMKPCINNIKLIRLAIKDGLTATLNSDNKNILGLN